MRYQLVSIACAVMSIGVGTPAFAGDDAERERVYDAYLDFDRLVVGGDVTPNWIGGGSSFWYAEGGPQDRVILKVDPVANEKRPLLDPARLQRALADALGAEPAGRGIPFDDLTFLTPTRIRFAVEGVSFALDLDSYRLTKLPSPSDFDFFEILPSEQERLTPQTFFKESFTSLGRTRQTERLSPDGKWFASMRDNNIVLRATIDGRIVPLTHDGSKTIFWDVETKKWNPWSPDGQRLAAFKVDTTGMLHIPSTQWLKPFEEAAEVMQIPAGGVLNRNELYIFNVQGGAPVHVDLGDTTDKYLIVLGWRADGSELIFARYDRLLTRIEIMAADARSGAARVVMTERSKTWLTNQHDSIWDSRTGFTLLPDSSGFLWRSERDGWANLYLYDMQGRLLRQLTKGHAPVTDVVAIDQARGLVYFQANGDANRPYDNHLYRVGLDGRGLRQLTDGEGIHTIRMAPTKDYFVDSYSSVANPPKSVLRKADGTFLQTLAEADISRLKAVGWVPPKEFVVKAADGVTDLWVTVNFPYDFDPAKKYPVVEDIYAGPQWTHRAMDFRHDKAFNRALAQRGFLTLTMDARGTPGRSKAFHDTVYRNWGQFEIADHAGAIKQLGQRYPYFDLDRVGITGGSWGGHFTVRALVQAPELYKTGVAEVPGLDSRAYTLYEVYLGMPADNKAVYDAADVIALAPRLKGDLLLTAGLNDTGTARDLFKLSDALVRAGIRHQTMVYPSIGHAYVGGPAAYNLNLKKDWFVEHLRP